MLETIFEKYTIEVVVNRTRISRRNLEKLRDGDFSGFTRPQALGFVRILEREFGEDFGDLRREIETRFESDAPQGGGPIFSPKGEVESGGGSKGWIVAVVILAVAALGFYLFRHDLSPASPRVEPAPVAAPAARTEAPKKPAAQTKPDEAAPAPEAEPKTSPAEAEAAAPAEPAAETAVPKKEEKKAEEPYVPLEPVALTPVVKLWFGIIDLKTKKRSAKVTARPYEIDSHGRKLLVTGHGRFEISDAFGNLFKFNDARKHYFLIDDGLVREIDASEFRRLNGGKGW